MFTEGGQHTTITVPVSVANVQRSFPVLSETELESYQVIVVPDHSDTQQQTSTGLAEVLKQPQYPTRPESVGILILWQVVPSPNVLRFFFAIPAAREAISQWQLATQFVRQKGRDLQGEQEEVALLALQLHLLGPCPHGQPLLRQPQLHLRRVQVQILLAMFGKVHDKGGLRNTSDHGAWPLQRRHHQGKVEQGPQGHKGRKQNVH